MSFNVSDCVTVVGLCFLLWWLPSPFPLLPALAALVFPLYVQDAAFTAYISSLLFGSLYQAVTIAASWSEIRNGA